MVDSTAPACERRALETAALHALFEGLDRRAIRYAVLRNYENLPDSVGARDVDIVVTPHDLDTAARIVCDLAELEGLQIANHYRDERLLQFTLARRLASGGLFDLKIDFFTDSQAYGVELMTAAHMLQSRRSHRGLPVVSDQVLLLDKLLFHLAVGQPLHPKYDGRFSLIARGEGAEIVSALAGYLGQGAAERIVDRIAAGEGSRMAPLSRRERLAMMWRISRRGGLSTAGRILRFLAHRLRNRVAPHGWFMSLSGPDGSGKTTVIDLIMADLRQVYGFDVASCRHFRPSILPRIAIVAKAAHAVDAVDADYDRPHRSRPSGTAGSLVRLAYYWVDYVAGYAATVRPRLVDRQLIVFDRYFFDMICDPGRSRIDLPFWLLAAVTRLTPLPRYSFFIRVRPDVASLRKGELTADKVETLNARYEALASRGLLITIDNDGAPEEAAARIVTFILSQRDKRARHALERFGA